MTRRKTVRLMQDEFLGMLKKKAMETFTSENEPYADGEIARISEGATVYFGMTEDEKLHAVIEYELEGKRRRRIVSLNLSVRDYEI